MEWKVGKERFRDKITERILGEENWKRKVKSFLIGTVIERERESFEWRQDKVGIIKEVSRGRCKKSIRVAKDLRRWKIEIGRWKIKSLWNH